MSHVVIAAEAALDDAAHRELVQAPGEIDERNKEKQRSQGAARRCRGAVHFMVARGCIVCICHCWGWTVQLVHDELGTPQGQ